MELPALTGEDFMLALSIHPDERRDLDALESNGWRIVDPLRVAGTPAFYRSFVQESKAEFGIAKAGYVASNCGWISDRSICYLASGRPVLAQDTGLANLLPTTEGLLTFTTCEEAIEVVDAVRREPGRHQRAARRLAETHFDSSRVLGTLVEKLALD